MEERVGRSAPATSWGNGGFTGLGLHLWFYFFGQHAIFLPFVSLQHSFPYSVSLTTLAQTRGH